MTPATSPAAQPAATSTQRIPDRLMAALLQQLESGERLVWVGRPSPRRMLVLHGCSALLLGVPILVVGAIARLVIAGRSGSGASPAPTAHRFVVAWDGLFVAAFALILLSRLWAWRTRLYTVYAITDRRALVLEAVRGSVAARSFSGEQLARAVLRAGPDGWGDIVFQREVFGSGIRRVQNDVGFLRIPDVAGVQRLLPVSHPR